MNAFEMVKPRSSVSKIEKKMENQFVKSGPMIGSLRVLDRNGRFNAPLEPRRLGSIVIEDRAVGKANTEKRKALMRGGL